MMMLEKNSDEIIKFIDGWVQQERAQAGPVTQQQTRPAGNRRRQLTLARLEYRLPGPETSGPGSLFSGAVADLGPRDRKLPRR